MGVISAGRAQRSKRRERGEERRASKGMVKKRKKIREKRERAMEMGRLSARPRCPSCPAPAAVRNSHKMAAQPGRAQRLKLEEGRGGRGQLRGRRGVTWRRAEAARPPEGRRKEPKRKGEAEEGTRKEPNPAENDRRQEKAGKSRRRI